MKPTKSLTLVLLALLLGSCASNSPEPKKSKYPLRKQIDEHTYSITTLDSRGWATERIYTTKPQHRNSQLLNSTPRAKSKPKRRSGTTAPGLRNLIDSVETEMTKAQVRQVVGKPDAVKRLRSGSYWAWSPNNCFEKENRKGIHTKFSYGQCSVTFDLSGKVISYSKGKARAYSTYY